MITTDVVTPRLPPLRGRRLALMAIALLALIAIPAYQGLSGAFGGSTRSAGSFGPRLSVSLDRTQVTPREIIRGVLTIEAPNGLTTTTPALLSVYPGGFAMTVSNAVGTVYLDVPRSIPASGKAVVPFTLDPGSLPAGEYNLNVELRARVDVGDAHAIVTTVTTAGFARVP